MKDSQIEIDSIQFIGDLKEIVGRARRYAYTSINYAQVSQNWLIGQKLVMQEQGGKARAEYGRRVIEIASKALTAEFGKGFSQRNLWKYKQFYLTFKGLNILPTLSAECCEEKVPTLSAEFISRLSWSHFERFDDLKKSDTDNPTIGILLCTETDKTIARYSVLNENKQLFASKYMDYLPSEEELRREIERQKEVFLLQQNDVQ